MRRDIVVLGFFIIVLILTAGCSSPQNGVPTGSKSQNPTQGNTNVETKDASSQTSLPECNLPSTDPIRFQNFLPSVPGWTGKYGKTVSPGNNYSKDKSPYGIMEWYQVSDKSNVNTIIVGLFDLGPCVTESTGVNTRFFNSFYIGTKNGETTSRINFHGYPAIHIISNYSPMKPMDYINGKLYIGINNRLYAGIETHGPNDSYSISEAEANMEKFANAIDFKGFAASV